MGGLKTLRGLLNGTPFHPFPRWRVQVYRCMCILPKLGDDGVIVWSASGARNSDDRTSHHRHLWPQGDSKIVADGNVGRKQKQN